MKVFKRNAVIITVLLFVAVAVFLNWSYNRGQDLAADNPVTTERLPSGEDEEKEETIGEERENQDSQPQDGEDTESLYFRPEHSALSAAAVSYFDSARLTREQARDSATTLLQEAAAIGTASQEEIDNALGAITTMAAFALQEAQLENILMAKDFEQAVVFIRAEGISVIVNAPAEGLSDVAVARVTEAVISELGVGAEQITIIPVS
ncbi:MAG: SpoIIIAH-like family protein [Oscillospiraceae bacterium]|nr:SpoIIIAH-like family protein [Oscillospiraceae bacterium]